jgi:hypothetical protein
VVFNKCRHTNGTKEGKMNRLKKRLALLWLAAVMIAALIAPGGHASAGGNANPGVIPPNAKFHGLSYGEWGARWWQWIASFPIPTNPALDQTGHLCSEGDMGHVWFLAGTFGGNAIRNCSIPTGVAVFYPVLNNECDNVAPDGTHLPFTFEDLRACAHFTIPSNVTTEVDGVPLRNLQNYESLSPLSTWTFPEDNFASLFGYFPHPGEVYSFVGGGYYIMHTPFSRGSHSIHVSAPGFLDVTYHLTVGH